MTIRAVATHDDEGSASVSTIERAFSILGVFSRVRPQATLTEIAAATGLHKATAFRLASTLCRSGLLRKDQQAGLYRLGERLVVMGEIAKAPPGLVGIARPFLRQLRDAVGETTYLSIRDGDVRIDIEQLEGLGRLRRDIVLGEPRPLHIGSPSKVLLASLSDRELSDYLGRVDLRLNNPDAEMTAKKLREEIRNIRQQGYASNINRTQNAAVASAPVRNSSGATAGVLSVTAPMTNGAYIAHNQLVDAVVSVAGALSRELGAVHHWD